MASPAEEARKRFFSGGGGENVVAGGRPARRVAGTGASKASFGKLGTEFAAQAQVLSARKSAFKNADREDTQAHGLGVLEVANQNKLGQDAATAGQTLNRDATLANQQQQRDQLLNTQQIGQDNRALGQAALLAGADPNKPMLYMAVAINSVLTFPASPRYQRASQRGTSRLSVVARTRTGSRATSY